MFGFKFTNSLLVKPHFAQLSLVTLSFLKCDLCLDNFSQNKVWQREFVSMILIKSTF